MFTFLHGGDGILKLREDSGVARNSFGDGSRIEFFFENYLKKQIFSTTLEILNFPLRKLG